MKALTKLTAIAILLITTTSCFIDGIKGNRNVVSEDRSISSNFDQIKVEQGIQLFITQDNLTELKVEADENIIDLLKTEVEGNELKIYFEKNIYRAKSRNVYLSTKDISKIRASSGSSVKSENTIQVNSLELDASSGSSIKIQTNANKISSESSSGAHINVLGKSKSLYCTASSGSSINANKLKTTDATAKASSGANIKVYVTKKLTARASSGGDIDYKGNPKNVNKDTSSGGSVSRS
ncbi:head GIN domain-containing protein [Lutibacter citreus]|uniref:head GIN domain-containing protein n=1 Tax=Lutibacter citreus TaxID=2138210 RepID=UPI000DBE464B|nr:head GIN domain-containing protein [Lutibacter citreus]